MTKQTKGQKSKDKILDVSLELFTRNGYANTSAQEIANLCGISQTTVFYHFKNKKYLFESLLNRVITNNRSFVGSNQIDNNQLPNEFEQLVLLLESNINWAYKFPKDAQILLMLFNFATSDDDFKSLASDTIDNGRDLVLEALKRIDSKNSLSQLLSLEELAIIIQQYVNGVIFQMLARTDRQKVMHVFKTTLETYLNTLLFDKRS